MIFCKPFFFNLIWRLSMGNKSQDRGSNTGKQKRKKLLPGQVGKCNKKARKFSPASPPPAKQDEDGFSCHYGDELRRKRLPVTPEVCIGNIHSIQDPACKRCMKCVPVEKKRACWF